MNNNYILIGENFSKNIIEFGEKNPNYADTTKTYIKTTDTLTDTSKKEKDKTEAVKVMK